MKTLNQLKILAITYAQHGGAWPFLSTQLQLNGVPECVANWYITCARENLSASNAHIAAQEFNRIEIELASGTFGGAGNQLTFEALTQINCFKRRYIDYPDL
ncbi:hypothetical protein ACSSTY_003546 [Vibrio cholerae]|nr:hypothetical protein [Vibrio cholerae]